MNTIKTIMKGIIIRTIDSNLNAFNDFGIGKLLLL